MKPSKVFNGQYHLFTSRLSTQLSPNHPLMQLSQFINWQSLEREFFNLFVENIGQPAKPVRLVVGILMLQHMYGMSDENIVHRWIENPYWQSFCGYDFLQHKLPMHPTSLIKWRHRLGSSGLNKIFQETVSLAVKTGAVKKKVSRKSLSIQQ